LWLAWERGCAWELGWERGCGWERGHGWELGSAWRWPGAGSVLGSMAVPGIVAGKSVAWAARSLEPGWSVAGSLLWGCFEDDILEAGLMLP